MGATTSLNNPRLAVEPGAEVTCQVLVRNTGSVVDQFAVEILGDTARWAIVEPPTVNLLPGDETTATVRFRPPRMSEVPAGEFPFGLRVRSKEDPEGTVVEEGVVEVAQFTELALELVPVTSRARWRAKHTVAVDNGGNHPIVAELDVAEPEGLLQLQLDQTTVRIDRGAATFVNLRAWPFQRFLRGPDRTHPFQVLATTETAEPTTAAGTVVQRPLWPKWLLPLLAALLALLLLAVVLWLTVLRPVVKSAAREAAAEQNQQVAAVAQEAKDQAGAAEKKADVAQQAAGVAPGGGAAGGGAPGGGAPGDGALGGGGGGGGEGGAGAAAASARLVDFRIATNAQPQPPGTFVPFNAAPPPPPDKTLLITDLVLQNPFGDTGMLQIRRGEVVLLEVGLNNFRDLDYHYVQPLRFSPGQPVVVAVSCQNPGPPCRPSVSFSGRLEG